MSSPLRSFLTGGLGARGLALGLLVVLGFGAACTGGDSSSADSPTPDPIAKAIPGALASQTWPVRMADAQARAPFEAHAGWALLFQRDHAGALAAFAADAGDGRGLARTHVELAALYRQAALLAARSAAQVYGDARQPEDPAEVPYLYAVGSILSGDTDAGTAALALQPDTGPDELRAAVADWKRWVDAGAAWPPDDLLVDIPGAPGEVHVDGAPDAGALPHYRLAEQTDDAREVELSDPTTLYLLARWHDAAALAAAPAEDAALLTALQVPWLLPSESAPVVADDVSVDDAWLFGSFLLSSADLPFVVAASVEGVAAVDAWKDRSPLAAAVAPAIVDGQVVPDRMLDQAAWLGQQLEQGMARVGGGEEAFHKPFGQIVRVAALRAGMIVADANGQFRDAGVLRINALDRSAESAADPVFLASVAAWDAGNKNALRAQELVHRLIRRYPPLQAVRYPLDALHIRLSRNAAPAAPVH